MPAAEAWAILATLSRSLPGVAIRSDCLNNVKTLKNGERAATRSRSNIGRLWRMIFRALDDWTHPEWLDIVWVPAHLTKSQIGIAMKGDGRPITELDWLGNKRADELAKKGAALHRLPATIIKEVKCREELAEHFARRLGAVTFAANNYKAYDTAEDGSTKTVILRDSSGLKPEKRSTISAQQSSSKLSSSVAAATLVNFSPPAPSQPPEESVTCTRRKKAKKRIKEVPWTYTPPAPPKKDWYPVGTAAKKEHYKELFTATASEPRALVEPSFEGLANLGGSVFAAPSAAASASASACNSILDHHRPTYSSAASSTAANLRERPLYSRGRAHSGRKLEKDVSALLQPRKS